MKKLGYMLIALLVVCGVVFAAQDTDISNREVRDPLKLEAWLEANAADAQTRIAAVEAAGVGGTLAPAKLIVGNSSSNATAMAVTGDVTVTQDGTNITTAIAAGVVVNADIAAGAAIAASKLANADLGDVTIAAGVVSIDNDVVDAATIGTIVQSDTNATTTVTDYTPAFVGQALIGAYGVGTNGVWIAKGVTTNDWVQVAP